MKMGESERERRRGGEKVAARCESERKRERVVEGARGREGKRLYISRLSRPSVRTVVFRVWMWPRGYIGAVEAIFNSIC